MQKICGTVKMCFFLKQDPDPGSGFKILICRIRIRPKMDRIRNPADPDLLQNGLNKYPTRVQDCSKLMLV